MKGLNSIKKMLEHGGKTEDSSYQGGLTCFLMQLS